MSARPSVRPFAEPLEMTALELADLVRLGDTLQLMIARVAARSATPDPELIAEGQVADVLTQRLAGVAAFVTTLARCAPGDARIDVLEAVKNLTLAEQARRLSGPVGGLAPCPDTGDLVLFD